MSVMTAERQQTVLFVDDDEDIRRLGEISLGRLAGWRVLTAADGAEAVSTASRENPDVILLDMVMPHMDGATAMGHLQEDPRTRDIPVIVLTGRAAPEDHRHFVSLGARGVIAKPFPAVGLGQLVMRILRGV